MIVGMGIDLVDVNRINHIYEKFGKAFLKKILAPEEMARLPLNPAPYIASRFAAKEAAVKALGTGFSGGITPLMFAIHNNSCGRPDLLLAGRARERAIEMGARRVLLSLSHEKNCAIAAVILED